MLNITDHGNIRELRLDRPPVNALNGALLHALAEALRSAFEESEAVVIAGRPGLFSAGLDVPELLELDRDGLRETWQHFMDVLETLACSPMPVAAAITGHSPAGGAVISVFCDYRIMADGEYKFGLNETQVGLVVPHPIRHAMARLAGPHRAERLMVSGALMTPREALTAGLVDELAEDPDAAVEAAVRWCRELLSLPRRAMLGNRRQTRADIREWFTEHDDRQLGRIVDDWFEGETQQVLKAMVSRLKKD